MNQAKHRSEENRLRRARPEQAPPRAARLCLVAIALILFSTIFSTRAKAGDPAATLHKLDGTVLSTNAIDLRVQKLMAEARVPGLGLAWIENGQVLFVKAYGQRTSDETRPLATDTVMYGASLTKFAFAYTVMQLVDERVIELDRPIKDYLKQPLPHYEKYADLANDARWEKLTARMLLNHTSGFQNFRFINPDGKLDFKFDPGSRYAYSGEGFNLLQFVLEEGLKLKVGEEMQRRVFDRFGMTRSGMTWRETFATNYADGYSPDGKIEPHHHRTNVRAAGSMDTSVADFARFFSGFLRGDGLSTAARAEMLRPQIAITSAHQFPTLVTNTAPAYPKTELAAGLGAVLFQSRYGPAFWKGGHDEWTANLVVGVPGQKRGIVLLSNSTRAETIYPLLVEFLLGDLGLPWPWEYNLEPAP